ncbi:MAG: NAD-dependent epimerase/dehydratase family protein [Patescibacteria group bacterium]
MPAFIEAQFSEVARKLGDVADRLEGTTILINGAGGFLGNHIVGLMQYLNRTRFTKPVHTIALDNFITGVKGSPLFTMDDSNLEFIQHDVCVPFETERNIDYIMHAASIASPVYYAKYPMETLTATIDGLRHTLELARAKKAKGVLYFSSSEIYGDPTPENIPTTEEYHGHVSCTSLRACYDESKRVGETIATIYHRVHGVPVVSVRPFNAYGPGMKIDDKRVLPNFLNAALDGSTIEIHNRGAQTRTFAYTTDCLNGFLRALLLGRSGEAYNIGTDEGEISIYNLAKKVESVYGSPLDIQHAEYPEGYPVGDPSRRLPDITKARTELGYEPDVTLEEGLKRMLAWYRLLRERGA